MKPTDDHQSISPLNPREVQVATRFNREYRGEHSELPPEVEAMPIFSAWVGGTLNTKKASCFWQIQQPTKNQHCLDIGCGVSFLVYPWREWGAYFYGQELSSVAQNVLNARGPQLNTKLFKGVKLGTARQLHYDDNQFDLAIATGWSCYYPLEYWQEVMQHVKRVLKPSGYFVFDVLDPQAPLAEDWAILETYLGTEVFLEPLSEWTKLLKASGAKLVKQLPGELFVQFKVSFN